MFATGVGNPDPEDSIRIIHKALDAGINLVDTADAYGDSEEIVGRALKGRRDNVVLTTKVGRPMGTDPNQQGASRRWIFTAAENSLRRLQTDHIDVYQIHRPDPDTDIEETLSAQQYGMGILAWGPLGQGMLTGRVRRALTASRA